LLIFPLALELDFVQAEPFDEIGALPDLALGDQPINSERIRYFSSNVCRCVSMA
jgi:hypothetical protein